MARDLTPCPLSHRARGFTLSRWLKPHPGADGHKARLRRLASFVALALMSALLAGCAFNPGGEQLAWQMGTQLWVANPDGSNARQLAPRDIAGYAWSPDHHELVFRYSGAANPPPAGAPWAAPETSSELAVVSISGGQATQITPTGNGLVRSDAWWDPDGNRLLYREYGAGAALAAVYYDSQNDQPVGIARKVVLNAASLPTLSPDGMRVAVIDPEGAVRVGPPAQTGKIMAHGAIQTLSGTGRPARLLWRPGHETLLYPTAGAQPDTTELRWLDLTSGQTSQFTTQTNLRDVAFSPDGSMVLLDLPDSLLIWPVDGAGSRRSIPESDPLAQAFWSPDGRWILVEDSAGMRLYSVTGDTQPQATLTYAAPLSAPTISAGTPWRPATANPWNPDGSAIVFASGPAQWQGASLARPQRGPAGIYVEQIGENGPSGAPTLIASGDVRVPSWGYSDPSTVLLTPAAG
jgi:Tol biopolymer transport system component